MLPAETPPRPQLDSGQIDLIAMDREAREAMQKMEQEAIAKKAPPTPPSTAPWAVESSLEDDDAEFARSLASPWQRIPRVKLIAGAAGAFVLLLVVVIFASSGGSDDAKKTATLAAPPEPTVTALPSSIPPPPPAAATTPETPTATTAAAAAKPPTTTVAEAKPHNDKPRKPSRRVKPSGPKLMKVQSSGT